MELLPDRALTRISVATIENFCFLVWNFLFGLVVSMISELLPDRAFAGNPIPAPESVGFSIWRLLSESGDLRD